MHASLPWRSSAYDSVLSMLDVAVRIGVLVLVGVIALFGVPMLKLGNDRSLPTELTRSKAAYSAGDCSMRDCTTRSIPSILSPASRSYCDAIAWIRSAIGATVHSTRSRDLLRFMSAGLRYYHLHISYLSSAWRTTAVVETCM
jgi:hypothetical protein